MAKTLKKKVPGQNSQFYTRSQAMRKLQMNLKDFRKLCILKGIYPRDPKKKFRGTDKTYFHKKDITYLLSDPIVGKFRDIKAHLKKHKKAMFRGEKEEAKNILKSTPKLPLQHIIKERYPKFEEALRDLDDALSLMSIYAIIPSHQALNISKDTIDECSKLINEFQAIAVIAKSITKAFFSIKGIYFQAELYGVNITWIQPYRFAPLLPFDVDFSIMNDFILFYITLVKFVNYKMKKDFSILENMIEITNGSLHFTLAPFQNQIKELQKIVATNIESKGILSNNSKGNLFNDFKYH